MEKAKAMHFVSIPANRHLEACFLVSVPDFTIDKQKAGNDEGVCTSPNNNRQQCFAMEDPLRMTNLFKVLTFDTMLKLVDTVHSELTVPVVVCKRSNFGRVYC